MWPENWNECSNKLQELVNLAKALDKRLIYKNQLHVNIRAINIKIIIKITLKLDFKVSNA